MLTRRALLQASVAAAARRRPVFFSHDGGMPDDYLSLALLLTIDAVDVMGVVVTAADSYIEPAMAATGKILDLMGRAWIPYAASTVKGVNPFPAKWRALSRAMPGLIARRGVRPAPVSGTRLMVDALRRARSPVTVLETGPLSTVADAINTAPEIESKIREIVWMGGALSVRGNVEEPDHDGSAEWNVYWDPPAAARVWATKIPIVMCPLDVTNRVPLTAAFVDKLRAQARFPLSRLAADAYGRDMAGDLYFWDLLTTSYLGVPEIFTLREWETTIVVAGGSAGRTRVRAGGRKIRALDTVNVDRFYDYLFTQWAH